MRLKILLIAVPVFFLSLFLLFRFYTNARENEYNEKISIAQSLIKSGKEGVATYDTSYTILKMRGDKEYLTIKYSFVVDGKMFNDSKEILEAPEERFFKIVYLPTNPEIHSENPKEDLEYYTKLNLEKDSGVLAWSLFVGSILTIFLVRRNYLNELEQDKLFD